MLKYAIYMLNNFSRSFNLSNTHICIIMSHMNSLFLLILLYRIIINHTKTVTLNDSQLTHKLYSLQAPIHKKFQDFFLNNRMKWQCSCVLSTFLCGSTVCNLTILSVHLRSFYIVKFLSWLIIVQFLLQTVRVNKMNFDIQRWNF